MVEGEQRSERRSVPLPDAHDVRIGPLADDELTDEQAELLSGVRVPGNATVNIFTTLVRHPGLFRRWLPLGGKLLGGKLPARDRELLILRTGWLCEAAYEWAQHVPIARGAGVTDAEVEAVASGPDDPSWSPEDAALVRAADELHDDSVISDETWAALSARYGGDEKLLIEVPMLVGHYHMVAYALNSLGTPIEATADTDAGADA